MKKLLILLILGFSFSAFAQFKDSGFPTESVKDGIVAHDNNSFLGLFNPNSFQMHHSYDLSYSSFGGQGLALGVYTNSMFYKFSSKLNIEADISIVNSPYSTLGKSFQQSLNGIYLSNAAINYRPWKNFFITVQYSNLPYSYYSPYNNYSYFNRGFFGWDNSADTNPFEQNK